MHFSSFGNRDGANHSSGTEDTYRRGAAFGLSPPPSNVARMPRARWSLLTVSLAVLAVFALTACSGGGKKRDSSAGTTTTAHGPAPIRAPRGDLYRPPVPLPTAAPGTLIYAQLWAQRVADRPLYPTATIWLMLYHSRDRTGRDIAVSGFAVVPKRRAPAGGRPVYAWAHGLVGLGDRCAPSKAIPDNLPPYGRAQVKRGAVLVATDYEGLGTPGDHPYLVGVAEGHDVLDSVRAAASLPDVGALGGVVIAGHAQGGGAALWAAQIASSYAPELHLRGVIALAPAADLPTMVATIDRRSPYVGLALLAAGGLHAGYPDFDPSTFLTPAAVAELGRVRTECADTTIARYRTRAPRTVFTHDPNAIPAVHTILADNSPGGTDPGIPILLLHGDNDEQITVGISARLHAKFCELHATVRRITYARANHDGVVKAAQNDALRWITDRFKNKPAHSDCR
jgi:hypothetical protein